MTTKITHETLGECKVLLEINQNDGKCFKFVEAYKIKKKKKYQIEEMWLDSIHRNSKGPHYYALWGNSQNESTMGWTRLTTKAGYPPSQNKASSYFFELVNASKNMNFKM